MIVKLTLITSIKKLTSSWFKPLLFALLFIAGNRAFAQAPNISYQTPLTYSVNTAVTPLVPKNTGGAVPGRAYGQVTTLAGNGTTGAVDGQGSAAQFSSPRALATDAAGNIYVADNGNNKIRKVTPQGLVSTLAGSGIAGNMNGSGTGASFTNPSGVWVDANGNVYVADSGNQLIRKITPNGTVTTLAGNGQPGANDGTTFANFNFPNDVVGDISGNIYVSDYVNDEIRKVAPDGTVTTFAGYPVLGNADGKGNTARFYNLGGITINAAGNLYVTDDGNDEIREITPAGLVTTLAGNGTKGSTDAKGALATFSYPTGVTIDQAGNLYVSDTFNSTIRKIDPSGNVTTFAGITGVYSFTNSDRLSATFNDPYGVTVDGFGNLYVSDEGNASIRAISLTGYTIDKALPPGLTFDATTGAISGTPSAPSPATAYTITAYNLSGSSSAVVNISVNGITPLPVNPPKISYQTPQVFTVNKAITPLAPLNTGGAVPGRAYGQVTTLAGNGTQGDKDGQGSDALFGSPRDIATDAAGNIYVADNLNNKIRKVTPQGLVSTFAGNGSTGQADGAGANASFITPCGVWVDATGNVYVADSGNNLIRVISPNGTVSTYAGNGQSGSADGNAKTANFDVPDDVVGDAAGDIYVTDLANDELRKIASDGTVSTFAGYPVVGSADGKGSSARFYNPGGMTIDPAGNLYVSDNANNEIRKVTPAGVVSTVAGNTNGGFANGNGAEAAFYYPSAVTIDQAGNLYVSDTDNSLIRKIDPSGNVTTFAGVQGLYGFADGDRLSAAFNDPNGVVADGHGNLYVSDEGNAAIRKINLTGYDIDKPLPAGLTFDATTGTISGTPTAPSPATNYTITAYNLSGSSSAVVNIEVNSITPIPVNPPKISYQTPQVYTNNTAIVPLTPTNTGGAVPANAYASVTTIAGTGSFGKVNGKGTAASFDYANGMVMDNNGNIYVADVHNSLIRKIAPDGTVSVYAGNGTSGFMDGAASAAEFNFPIGLTIDPSGNIYVADYNNNAIRKITPAGAVTTFAGGTVGFADGTGTAAELHSPYGLVCDASGNIYVADEGNGDIRKITPAGVVTTFAGNGTENAADGTGIAAGFSFPLNIAIGPQGNFYVVDNNGSSVGIRMITPAGVVTTLAGGGASGYADGQGSAAQFANPIGIATDALGNVYVGDAANMVIRKITPGGLVSTIAGTVGISGDKDGVGTAASFNEPFGLLSDNNGNLYVSDFLNYQVRKIALTGYTIDKTLPAGLTFDPTTGIISGTPTIASPSTDYTITAYNLGGSSSTIVNITVKAATPPPVTPPKISYQTPQVYTVNTTIAPLSPTNTGGSVTGAVSTFAGSGTAASVDGTGTAASFNYPAAITTDPQGNVYVADEVTEVIRKITPGGVVTTIAGTGYSGHTNGTGSNASFSNPVGLVSDAQGNIYASDYYNNLIRKITPSGVVTTFAGDGSFGNKDGTGTAASFNAPCGITIDPQGNLYVADQGNDVIRKITPGAVVTTFAGSGVQGADNGTGTAASFAEVFGITADAQGNLFVADDGNSLIREITPAGKVSTLAGTGAPGSQNGTGTNASFTSTQALTTDAQGNVYVTSLVDETIRKITPAGVVTTVAGSGAIGSTNGTPSNASFYFPDGITADKFGNFYVSDTYNNIIRKVIIGGYTIDKTLPAGLTFDPTTGIISGTPTTASPATDYTITAYNAGGSGMAVVNITVKAAKITLPAPPKISYQTPQVYTVNIGISPLSPTNTGGAVPATIYGQVTTFAGNGSQGFLDGTGTSASFNHPTRLGEDATTGNLYVADRDNNTIRKVTPTADVTTFANGFDQPNGVIVDPKGKLFVADAASNTIKEVSPSGTVSTYAGSGLSGSTDGTGTAASFNSPYNLTQDASGNIYVADSGNGSVRKITTGAAVSTFAGGFNSFDGIATDAAGNVYVGENNTIRKISPAGAGTNIAGSINAGATNGPAASATFRSPNGIAFDAIGNMYIADIGNNMIRKLDATGNVTTLAGSGVAGALDGTGASATFNLPNDVQSDPNGYLYVTDYGNSLIRKVIVTGYAIDKALPPGLTFDATTGTVSGTPTTTWPSTNYTITAYNTGGSSSALVNIEVTNPFALAAIPVKSTCSTDFAPIVTGGNGVYTYASSNTAVATIVAEKIHIVAPGTSTITVADGTTSASTLLTVNGPITPSVSITPGEYSACLGQSLTYTATPVNGGINPIYQWKVNGVDAGTNSATFTSSTLQNNDIITCTLTDTSDCTTGPVTSNKASLIADAYVTPAISIQASATGPVAPGTAITFTATPTNGGTAPSYQWAINGTNTGTDSPAFTYSCFADGDLVTCTLTNQGGKCLTALAAQSNTITVNVNNMASVNISASANDVYANTPVTFTATVANAANVSSYQWMVNGKSAGSNSAMFTTNTLTNGDVVTCAVITDGGCNVPVNSNAIQMIILPPLAIVIPNTFTPNGDGINDLWDIASLNYYRNCTVTIFTRYGMQVFYSKGYAKPWDGTYNGSKLASGTYYYIIDLANNTPKLSGYIAIIR